MTPQNPFNTWENSEEYYNLQDEIGKIKIQQSEYDKYAVGLNERGGRGLQNADARAMEFDRQLKTLNQRSEQGKFNFNFNKQYSSGGLSLGVKKQPKFNF
mgnify:FL=1